MAWLGSMTGTCSTSEASTLNASDFLDNLRRVSAELDRLATPGGNMRVIESPFCVRHSPARRHKKRRNQTAAYHSRIQKKWTKRYGTKAEPCAYIVDAGFLSFVGKALYIHPSLMKSLRAGTLKI